MGHPQPISETAFRRLVRTLSAEQLRSFPIERLPRDLLTEVVHPSDDPEKQHVIEELVWAACTQEAEADVALSDRIDAEARAAIETAERADTRGVDELNRVTDEMTRRWRPEDYGHDMLAESNQRLEQARDLAERLAERIGELNRSLAIIDRPFVGRDDIGCRLSQARARAKAALSELEAALGRYELIELDIAQGAMRETKMRCDIEMRRMRELEEQIESVRDKLRRTQGLGRLLKPGVAKQQREQLLQRLRRLTTRRDNAETFVSEKDLMHWLNVLVDASMFLPSAQWKQRAQKTRLLLYRLLNVYCLQQEMAAHEVATSDQVNRNARDAIGYYLSSERFILEYFSRKRQEVTLWLSSAASDKLAQLDRIRDAILADYRRQANKAGVSA